MINPPPKLHPPKFTGQERFFTTPTVSIIIGVYNKISFLIHCLEAIKKNTSYPNYEVIVIDDCSTEKSVKEFLHTLEGEPPYKVLYNHENLGYGKTNNVGFRNSSGTIILFLNADTEPQPNWLWEIVKLFNADPKIGVVGAKLIFPPNRDQSVYHHMTQHHSGIQLAGTLSHAGCYFNQKKLPTHMYAGTDPMDPWANEYRELQAVTGACLATRREVFEKVGGFEEEYLSMDYEDVDYCMTARSEGYKCVYCPSSVVYHHENVIKFDQRKYREAVRASRGGRGNVQRFLAKWRSVIVVDCPKHRKEKVMA